MTLVRYPARQSDDDGDIGAHLSYLGQLYVTGAFMKARCFLLLPIAAVMAGCASQVPVATNFSLSHQKVARTAHHWDVVAEDVAERTLDSISGKEELHGRAVYVAPARNTAFNTAFREFMITHLVSNGASVSVCKRDEKTGFSSDRPEVEIQYDTQLVVHGTESPKYRPGVLTLLAAGVAVLRNVSVPGPNTALVGGAALIDLAAGHAALPTRTEIIITTTVIEDNRFIARRSDVYYVPDDDARLFTQAVNPRSQCPDSESSASAQADEKNRAKIARQEMYERAMRRTNPLWRGSASYSY